MKLNKFVAGSYEIETLSKESRYTIYKELAKLGVRYIDTSICYNNDLLLKDIISDNHFKVISKIAPQYILYGMSTDLHLHYLGRNQIDIMLIHNPRAEWVNLAKQLEGDKRFKEVGVSNFSIDDLNKYKTELGHYPKYNEIEINPFNYDSELIEFCHNVGIKIIAYAIFGGKYHAMRTISDFTLSVLLSQIQKVADLCIIRADSIDQVHHFANADYYDTSEFMTYPKQEKCIEPMQYVPSKFSINDLGMYTYSKSYGMHIEKIDTKRFTDTEIIGDCNLIDYLRSLSYMEFITDYRVILRYTITTLLDLDNIDYDIWYEDEILHVLNRTDNTHKAYNVYLVQNNILTKINQNNDSSKPYTGLYLSVVDVNNNEGAFV